MLQQMMKQKDFDYEEQNNKIYGVVTAIVTNTKDPDKKGRIKMKYVWMGEAKAIESDWARVVSFMAGNARGAHFLPDVDDEVLVAFEHGNINSPYVVGALYNAKDKVIEENTDGKNNIKMLKSRSGHKITLDDTKDAEKFIIEDESGKRLITFDSSAKKLSIENKEDSGPIYVEAKGELTIKADKDIKIEGKADLNIKATKDVKIEGKNVTIKSSAALKIEAGSSLSAKSSAATTIKAGSSMTLKASAAAKFDALSLAFKGSGSAKMEGATLALKGTGSAKMEGAMLSLKGTATAGLEASGITSVKGAMVKIN
jgi:uncharacterized protein involved in type VI secretion and phage assembly